MFILSEQTSETTLHALAVRYYYIYFWRACMLFHAIQPLNSSQPPPSPPLSLTHTHTPCDRNDSHHFIFACERFSASTLRHEIWNIKWNKSRKRCRKQISKQADRQEGNSVQQPFPKYQCLWCVAHGRTLHLFRYGTRRHRYIPSCSAKRDLQLLLECIRKYPFFGVPPPPSSPYLPQFCSFLLTWWGGADI